MSGFCIDEVSGPDGTLAGIAARYMKDESGCEAGEKLKFPHLQPKYGFKVIDVTVVDMPDYSERDDDIYGDLDKKAIVRLTVDSEKYGITEGSCPPELKDNLSKWLAVGDDVDEDTLKLLDFEITNEVRADSTKEIVATIAFYIWRVLSFKGGICDCILSSPFWDKFWNYHMDNVITEGVCFSIKKVPDTLRDSLRKILDNLAKETHIDYHPNSNDIVRDLVHPALYSYIDGVSKFKKGKSKNDITSAPEYGERDFWGRKYEDSKFQWLPTNMIVSDEGKCSFKDYINNLSREKFPELYTDLEKLFDIFLPYFEEVWTYSKLMKFWNLQSDYDDEESVVDFEIEDVLSLKGRELQVIPKIVEYNLKPGQTYEGVWHAEGMSHENIVMTGIYFIDRDPELIGAKLKFKRSFHVGERGMLLYRAPQNRTLVVNHFVDDGLMPLGHFETDEGYILVFPNCHIHKIGKLVNESAKDARRRIIVFFVVNPEKRIISTSDIEPQQDVISFESAKQFRLELMAERKFDKEKLNIRSVELCEH